MFEVILPSQGQAYEQDIMEDEKLEIYDRTSTPGEGSRVRLCLVPGLRKYPFDRKRVDYNSFRKPGSGVVKEPYDLIAQSLVVID